MESEPKPGAELKIKNPNTGDVDVFGKVLEVDPPHRFSYTFRFSFYDDEPTRVVYELTERENGQVRVDVIHDEFDGETDTFMDVRNGWPTILNTLKAYMETGKLLQKEPATNE